jgi:hypothetical protein
MSIRHDPGQILRLFRIFTEPLGDALLRRRQQLRLRRLRAQDVVGCNALKIMKEFEHDLLVLL